MAFDFSKLRGRIVEKYGTCVAFCVASGMSQPGLSDRLNNRIQFKADEIYHFAALLDIPAAEIPTYFFVPKVR